MFTRTDHDLLSWFFDNVSLVSGLLFGAALVTGLLGAFFCFRSEKYFVLSVALSCSLFIASLAIEAGTPHGNIDRDSVDKAITENTAVTDIRNSTERSPLVFRDGYEHILADEVASRTPQFTGRFDDREVTFKMTLDENTGEVTDFMLMSPYGGVDPDDILAPSSG